MAEDPVQFQNPQFGDRSYAVRGVPSNANLQLGARNQNGLTISFETSPLINGTYTNLDARKIYANQYLGNTDFLMYRRDFNPDPVDVIYDKPRDKNSLNDESKLNVFKLGSPYSPTTTSPGAGNGVDPNALRGGSAYRGLVPADAPADAAAIEAVNPIQAIYKNRDASQQTDNVGQVRTFRLGVGSGVGSNRSTT